MATGDRLKAPASKGARQRRPSPVRVLLIDDDENERALLDAQLSAAAADRYRLDWTGDYEEALALLLRGLHDVYLIDYRLGERDGLELLREARRRGCRQPMILLTGLGHYDVDVGAMKAGASDYLVKGQYGPDLLERTIRYSLERTRTEERYRNILEGTRAILFQVDAQGMLTFVSEAAEGLWGLSADRLTGRELASLVHPDDRPRLRDLLKETWPPGTPSKGIEFRYLGQGGKGGWLFAHLAPSPSGEGLLDGVAQDISERKLLEESVLQSEKLAAMGQLAAGLSHELNNPLMTILGNAKALLDGLSGDDPRARPLKAIDRACQRCRDLVRELLAFARKEEVSPSDFDLRRCVVRALALVKPQARVRMIAVEAETGERPLLASGHRNQLEQVILNLCANALDAMPAGGTLRVLCREVPGSRPPRAEVLVSDTGPGIPPELRERIFEPFFTTKPAGKGTGLGLALVRQIAARHGGEVSVSSELGRGTAFSVTLPLLPDP